MAHKMGHPNPRLGFENGSPGIATECPRFPHDLAEIMGSPSASQLGPFCRLISAKSPPN